MIGSIPGRGPVTLCSALSVVALAAGLAANAVAAQEDVEQRTMEVNGATLEYVAQGEGQPVVFVHGSISDLRVWNAEREAVAAEFEFIAYTRRYFGEQPWPDEGEDFGDATQAADLAAFVQRLGRGPVHMVTHSGGGGVGTLAALQRPDLFRSIVHFEPGGATSQLLTTDEGRAANEARQKAQAPADAAPEAGNLEQALELFLDATFNRPGAFVQLPEEAQSAHLANARTLALPGGERPPLDCAMLMGLDIPTTLIVGDQTMPYFQLISDQMVRCMPEAEKVVLPGVSHDALEAVPDVFNAALLDALRGHAGS